MSKDERFETGMCVMCEAPFIYCQCDPCQHGKSKIEHCVFCERYCEDCKNDIQD